MELDLFENEKNDHTRRVLASFREAVSSDPEIALDIAVKNYDWEFFFEFLNILIEEPKGSLSMITVLKMAVKICLPQVFIVNYVYSCIDQVSEEILVEKKRKNSRFFCLFVCKALEYQVVTDSELRTCIGKFSMMFSWIPEAKKLYEKNKSC